MDIKGIDQIYYEQLQSLGAADKQIIQLDSPQAGQNVEGGKPLSFRLVQPDNTDQTRAADNRATRENLFKVLSDAKGLDTEFVNMLRSRLGIAENGTATGDQALSALDAREVINLAKAKSADLDGMLGLGKTLRKVQFNDNVKSVLRQTLSREANNPVVIDFLDPNKQPPSLDSLTKLCKLATMVKLSDPSWESDLAVAYLKGFSATITDEIALCGSLENPIVDEDKALRDATEQGRQDHATEVAAHAEPNGVPVPPPLPAWVLKSMQKEQPPKTENNIGENVKEDVQLNKPEEQKTNIVNEEWNKIPFNEDDKNAVDKEQKKENVKKDNTDNLPDDDDILDLRNKQGEDNKVAVETVGQHDEQIGRNDTAEVQNDVENNRNSVPPPPIPPPPLPHPMQENKEIANQEQPPTTEVNEQQPTTVEVPQQEKTEVNEPVVAVPEQKTPEEREFDKLMGAVVRLNAHLITGQKTEDVPKVAPNVAKDKVYQNALKQMKAANGFLVEVGKLSVEELVSAWKSAGKVGKGDYSKAFFSKDKTPESICWAVKKALGDQAALSALPQSVGEDKNAVKTAISGLFSRVPARAEALQELVNELDAEKGFRGAGVTVAEWMAQKSSEKIDQNEVNALLMAVTQDGDFGALLRVLEEMSHGGVDAKKPTTSRKVLRERLENVEKNLRESGKCESQIAKDLLRVLTDASQRLKDFKPPRVSETSQKVLLRLREGMFGETIRKFAETRKTALFKYLVKNNGSFKSLAETFDRFVNASEAYAKDASSKKFKALESVMAEVVTLMTVNRGSSFVANPQRLQIDDSIEKILKVDNIKVPIDPKTKLPPDHVKGLPEDDRKNLILAIENNTVRYIDENTVLYTVSRDLIRGKKTGIPMQASPYEESLIKEVAGKHSSDDKMISALFADTAKFVQSVRSFVRIGSRLADEKFSKALEHADDQDVLERIIVDQPISEVAVLRAIGGSDVPADVCETECTDRNLTNMGSSGHDSLVTYSLPDGRTETRVFRSESAAAAADNVTYEKQIASKILSPHQTLSNLSVAVGETAERLGVPDAAIQGKLAMCKGQFGVLMPDKPGQTARDVVKAVKNRDKDEGPKIAEVKLLANIVNDGYDSTNLEQRKLLGSLAKGYAEMTFIDLVTGVTDRNRSEYSIAFEEGRARVTGTANHISFSTYKTGLKTYHLSYANDGLLALKKGLIRLYKSSQLGDEFSKRPLDCPGVSKVVKDESGNIVGLDLEITDDTPEHIRNALAYGLDLRGGGELPPYMSKAMSVKLNNAAEMNALKAVWRKMMDKENYDAAVMRLEELQSMLVEGKVQVLDNDDAWADAEVVKKMLTRKAPKDLGLNDSRVYSVLYSTYLPGDFFITKVDGVEVNPKEKPDEAAPAQ